jgi:hypothetical protein
MKTQRKTRDRERRRALEVAVKARSNDFERYWSTWMATDGRDEASRWIAKSIGAIVGEMDQLKRRVANLERQRHNAKVSDGGHKTHE